MRHRIIERENQFMLFEKVKSLIDFDKNHHKNVKIF